MRVFSCCRASSAYGSVACAPRVSTALYPHPPPSPSRSAGCRTDDYNAHMPGADRGHAAAAAAAAVLPPLTLDCTSDIVGGSTTWFLHLAMHSSANAHQCILPPALPLPLLLLLRRLLCWWVRRHVHTAATGATRCLPAYSTWSPSPHRESTCPFRPVVAMGGPDVCLDRLSYVRAAPHHTIPSGKHQKTKERFPHQPSATASGRGASKSRRPHLPATFTGQWLDDMLLLVARRTPPGCPARADSRRTRVPMPACLHTQAHTPIALVRTCRLDGHLCLCARRCVDAHRPRASVPGLEPGILAWLFCPPMWYILCKQRVANWLAGARPGTVRYSAYSLHPNGPSNSTFTANYLQISRIPFRSFLYAA